MAVVSSRRATSPCFPARGRLTRTYNQAWTLFVIDEVHAVVGLCRPAHIPILMMSGTTHDVITRSLRDWLVVVTDESEDRCMQIPVRFDDDRALIELVTASVGRCTWA
jgi:hypothetical protein